MSHKRSEHPEMVFDDLGLPLPILTPDQEGSSDGSCGGAPLGCPRNELPSRGSPELFRHHTRTDSDAYIDFGRLIRIIPAESPQYRGPKATRTREGNQRNAS